MTRLVQAEALKLRTTRTSPALALVALAAVALVAAAVALGGDPSETEDLARQAFTAAGISHVFSLLLGALAVTTEFRHGTITPTLLVTRDRRRLLLAKLAAGIGCGLLLGLLAFGLAAAIALPAFGSRDIATGLDAGDVLSIVAGGAVGAGLFAALGIGLGALVRHQVGAVIGALGWVYIAEMLLGLLPGIGDTVARIGIGGLSSGVSGTVAANPDVELLGQVPAGLLLAVYAGALIAAGAAAFQRRDITD